MDLRTDIVEVGSRLGHASASASSIFVGTLPARHRTAAWLDDAPAPHPDRAPALRAWHAAPRRNAARGYPHAYIIIDAGSLASGNANIVGGGPVEQSVDKTILSAIANARSSTFYAPERRQAFEHEDGDLAVVVADPRNKNNLIVVIGWRSRIEEAREPGAELLPLAAQLEPFVSRWIEALDQPRPARDERGEARLCAGDRVRLREYVFDVVEPPLTLDGFSIMLCKSSVTKVWNDRLVVPLLDFWREFNVPAPSTDRFIAMALPKVVEIYQWSQATDLFSIGVLLLYSVYGQNQGETTCMERECAGSS